MHFLIIIEIRKKMHIDSFFTYPTQKLHWKPAGIYKGSFFFKSIGRHFVFLTWDCLFFLDFPSFLSHLWQHFVNSLSPVKSKKERRSVCSFGTKNIWENRYECMQCSGYLWRPQKSGIILQCDTHPSNLHPTFQCF